VASTSSPLPPLEKLDSKADTEGLLTGKGLGRTPGPLILNGSSPRFFDNSKETPSAGETGVERVCLDPKNEKASGILWYGNYQFCHKYNKQSSEKINFTKLSPLPDRVGYLTDALLPPLRNAKIDHLAQHTLQSHVQAWNSQETCHSSCARTLRTEW
jgi:hypothetical protein